MKIVPKFQSGGGFDSLFTVYKPVQVSMPSYQSSGHSSSESSQKSSKKDEDKGNLTQKDLFSMLKDLDGLPNEMKSIVSNLQSVLEMQNLTGIDTEDLATTYLNNLYKIKVAAQNKASFDEAIKTAKENGSIGEVAITLGGNLIAQDDKGNMQEITLQQYQEDPEQYHLLTNSNLGWMRKYNPNMAFVLNDTTFEIISNGVGFESFQKLLDTAKENLGSYKYGDQGIDAAQALAGLQELQGKTDEEKQQILDAIVNNTSGYTSNVENINALITYLSAALPKRARVWAAIKTGLPEQQALTTLISTYLSSRTRISTPDSKKTGSFKGSESSESSEDTIGKLEETTSMKLLNGYGVTRMYTISSGTPLAVQVIGNQLPLTKANGEPIGLNSTLQQAVSGQYSGILDIQHATIGGKPIDISMFNQIIVPDGQVVSIDFPYQEKNGEIIPDVTPEVAEAKLAADKELKQQGIDAANPEHRKKYYEKINEAYEANGLSRAYDDKGNLINNWRRFAVMNIRASNKALGMDILENNKSLKEITDDITIDNLIQITKDENFDKDNMWIFEGGHDSFYEGTVFIPIDVNHHAASTTVKTTVAQNKALEELQQAIDAKFNWNQAPDL